MLIGAFTHGLHGQQIKSKFFFQIFCTPRFLPAFNKTVLIFYHLKSKFAKIYELNVLLFRCLIGARVMTERIFSLVSVSASSFMTCSSDFLPIY